MSKYDPVFGRDYLKEVNNNRWYLLAKIQNKFFFLWKQREGKYMGLNSKRQLFCDHTRQHAGHFSYWLDEFHLSIYHC